MNSKSKWKGLWGLSFAILCIALPEAQAKSKTAQATSSCSGLRDSYSKLESRATPPDPNLLKQISELQLKWLTQTPLGKALIAQFAGFRCDPEVLSRFFALPSDEANKLARACRKHFESPDSSQCQRDQEDSEPLQWGQHEAYKALFFLRPHRSYAVLNPRSLNLRLDSWTTNQGNLTYLVNRSGEDQWNLLQKLVHESYEGVDAKWDQIFDIPPTQFHSRVNGSSLNRTQLNAAFGALNHPLLSQALFSLRALVFENRVLKELPGFPADRLAEYGRFPTDNHASCMSSVREMVRLLNRDKCFIYGVADGGVYHGPRRDSYDWGEILNKSPEQWGSELEGAISQLEKVALSDDRKEYSLCELMTLPTMNLNPVKKGFGPRPCVQCN